MRWLRSHSLCWLWRGSLLLLSVWPSWGRFLGARVGLGCGRGELMQAEEMGKITSRTRLIFAISSVIFLDVLPISPCKVFRREWKEWKRSYLRFAQTRADTKKLLADYRPYI